MKSELKSPYLITVIMLTMFTHHLLSMYGAIHWQVWSFSPKESEILKLKELVGAEDESYTASRFDDLASRAKGTEEAANRLMRKSEKFRHTGLLALLLSIVALFRMKGKLRLLPLPFGLYSCYLALTIM